jgi:hypothetical protein
VIIAKRFIKEESMNLTPLMVSRLRALAIILVALAALAGVAHVAAAERNINALAHASYIYTSRGQELRFFKELEAQRQPGVESRAMGGVSLRQALDNGDLERSEVGVIGGVQALFFDELPQALNQVEVGGIRRQKPQFHL